MTGAFRSQWIKLASPLLSGGSAAAVSVFAAILVYATFMTASSPGGSRLSDPPLVLADMDRASMLGELAGRSVMILGSVVLAVAAGTLAMEFRTGSIRTLLVRQPRRLVWLAGTHGAVLTFVTVLVALSVLVTVATAVAGATAAGVDTSDWWSAEGLGALGRSTVNLLLCLWGFATLGAALAILFRSAVTAIGVGLVYTLFEQMGAAIVPAIAPFLPVQPLLAVAQNGTTEIPYATAIVGSVLVVAAASTIGAAVILRRDVLD